MKCRPGRWDTSTFGCPPDEGESPTVGEFPGYRIILGHGDVEIHYHGADGGAPRRCEFADI